MYKLNHNSTSITRVQDGASIPADPANTDYAKFLADVEADPTCVADADLPSSAELNAPIIAQIIALEATQARPIREMMLGDQTATARLEAINDDILSLRAKLVSDA